MKKVKGKTEQQLRKYRIITLGKPTDRNRQIRLQRKRGK